MLSVLHNITDRKCIERLKPESISVVSHELHGGTIWVERTPDKDDTFSFTIPLTHR